ncbi:MAG TPA: FAD:protein FMN transferase, partial [Gammaproteobacteria bacterium]|nr:FAD:protein FMN transferase [Gammaproteobacteria bacterium]
MRLASSAAGRYAAVVCGLLALSAGLPARAEWLERHEAIMGTNIDVELWHDDPAQGSAAIDAVMDEMRRIDALMSHYKPDSQISAINARAFREPVVVDQELFDLLGQAIHFSEITEGAFD